MFPSACVLPAPEQRSLPQKPKQVQPEVSQALGLTYSEEHKGEEAPKLLQEHGLLPGGPGS